MDSLLKLKLKKIYNDVDIAVLSQYSYILIYGIY